MSDWLWYNAGQIPRVDEDLWLDLANVQLAQATRAFAANVLQIRQFWELPPYVLKIFAESLDAFTETAERLLHKRKLTPEEHVLFHDQIVAETKELLARKIAALDYQNTDSANYRAAIGSFNGIVNDVPELADAVRATLSSQLVLSWSAFEVLCGDLARAVDKQSEAKSFASTKAIAKHYALVFHNCAEIDAIVGSEAVRKLAIVRNLIAHDSGIVTEKTFGYAAEIGWTFPGEVGKNFAIDGEVVRSYSAPVIELGIKLIKAVDRWLNVHPDQKRTPE